MNNIWVYWRLSSTWNTTLQYRKLILSFYLQYLKAEGAYPSRRGNCPPHCIKMEMRKGWEGCYPPCRVSFPFWHDREGNIPPHHIGMATMWWEGDAPSSRQNGSETQWEHPSPSYRNGNNVMRRGCPLLVASKWKWDMMGRITSLPVVLEWQQRHKEGMLPPCHVKMEMRHDGDIPLHRVGMAMTRWGGDALVTSKWK